MIVQTREIMETLQTQLELWRSGLPLRGKRDDAKRLQLLQHVQARVDLELTCGGLPAEVLANRKRQLIATQILEYLYGLLNLAQLLSGESSAAEGSAGQCLNGRHHHSTLLDDKQKVKQKKQCPKTLSINV